MDRLEGYDPHDYKSWGDDIPDVEEPDDEQPEDDKEGER